MSAKEMFEKLGYELFFNMSQCLWYIKDLNGIKYNVRFNTIDDKFIDIWYMFEKQRKDFDINLELLQAINKQVEELGWLGSEDNE